MKAQLARFAIGLAAVVGLLATFTGSAGANPYTTSQAGSPGYWAGEVSPTECNTSWYGVSYVLPVSPYITRSPSYSTSTQTVWLRTRVDVWTSSGWAVYAPGTWMSRQLSPSQRYALFSGQTVFVQPGRYYRVVQFYEWWVGSVRIGSATNLFDQYSYTGYWVAATGYSPSYCYVPVR